MSTPKRLRDSAAIVLIRGPGDALETFWVRRSDAVPFMPGFHAFIGGTVDAADADLTLEGAPDDVPDVLRACAIREALEETGVLVAHLGPAPTPEILADARQALLESQTTLPALARTHGWRFDRAALPAAGRWTTPPFSAARFDTTFFLARVPDGQSPRVEPGELASGEWIRPRDAIEHWRDGRVTFAAPILHTLMALAGGERDLVARLVRAPGEAGQPVRRIELMWGVVLQPMKTQPLPPSTHTNAYLVGEQEVALVDPGSDDPAELQALFGVVDALAADGRRLTTVLLTHHHADHVAGLAAVRARYGVPVAAHAATASRVPVDRVLEDGDVVALAPGRGDWSLRAIHTPGHARGHLCFLEPRLRALFTGDHVIGGRGTVIVDPPEGDMRDYVASLERLLRTDVETLFPAHGSPQGAAHRRIRALIEHRHAREARVTAALTDAPQPIDALVERAYDDTPRNLWPLAERSLLAHLLKLERDGTAVREGQRWRVAPGAGRAGRS